jgi:carbon-monoxide dehydrogenase large subunit
VTKATVHGSGRSTGTCGGIAQGMAQTLYEDATYNDDGQLLTGTRNDDTIPKATMVPHYELGRTITPSPVNPMGVKGADEAGTIASTPAVANAAIDAVSHLGVNHVDMRMTPEWLWKVLQG